MSSRVTGRTRRQRAGCEAPRPDDRYASLESIVRAYKARFRKRSQEELNSFASESVADAVRRAGLAERPDGKRYDHQRRIPREVLQRAAERLGRANLSRARDFDELHERVREAIGSIEGIGRLTIYDTALRIGAKLSLAPKRVYLHTGTRAGARNLGLNWRAESLAVSNVPRALRELEPREIEDVLCIFDDHFARLPKPAV